MQARARRPAHGRPTTRRPTHLRSTYPASMAAAADTWQNWARNQTAHPVAVHQPASEHDLAAVVTQAVGDGRRVKVVGSGHSFTDIACTDGHLVELSRYNRVLAIDPDARTATVQAGIRLEDLNDELDRRGLAMPNLGDIAYQTVAGATSTVDPRDRGAPDRSGRADLGPPAGAGRRDAWSTARPTREPELFDCARVGLGALGIVSTVTLQCVPAFNLAVVEEPMRVDAILERPRRPRRGQRPLRVLLGAPHRMGADQDEQPHARAVVAAQPVGSEWRNDTFMQNFALRPRCAGSDASTPLDPRGWPRPCPASGRVDVRRPELPVFASPRLVRFYEMEYAIPREACAEALNRVRALRRGRRACSSASRSRCASSPPTTSRCRTASGRESCYIAIHVYQGMDYRPVLRGGASGSWTTTAAGRTGASSTSRPRPPCRPAMTTLGASSRPCATGSIRSGRFTNAYLDRVLGP